jgi:hypothetical protein
MIHVSASIIFLSVSKTCFHTLKLNLVDIKSQKDNLKTIMSGYEDGKLLRIKGKVIPRKHNFAAAMNSKMSSFRLWNFQFGHLNFDSLLKLKSQDLVKGLPNFKRENYKCEACIFCKKNQEAFQPSHSEQQSICSIFIVICVVQWNLLSVYVNTLYFPLMTTLE